MKHFILFVCLLALACSLNLRQHELDLGDAGSGALDKAKDVVDSVKGAAAMSALTGDSPVNGIIEGVKRAGKDALGNLVPGSIPALPF